jgi:hypothetical protein
MAITDYHAQILDFLENYRAEHPEQKLTYAFREKKGKKRTNATYPFLGNDGYISVGLYCPVDSINKSRSVSLVNRYDPKRNELHSPTLEISFQSHWLDVELH